MVDVATTAEPEVIPGALVIPEGRALDMWSGVDSTFVPALQKEMTPDERRETVRRVAVTAQLADDTLDLVLGELLYEVNRNNYWTDWDTPGEDGPRKYKDFHEYAELELGMKRSTARYRIQVYEKFVIELDLDKDILRSLDWSKGRLLLPVIDKANADGLLKKLKEMTYREVAAMVKEMRGLSKDTDSDGLATLVFKLYPEQLENVENAINIAKGMAKSEKPGHALDMICADFVGSAVGSTPDGALVSLGVLIKNIERAYGVSLEVKAVDEDRYAEMREKAEGEEEGKEE